MQGTVEEVGPLGRRLRLPIDKDEVEREVAKRLHLLRRHVDVRGFRRGKAPMSIIEQRHGAAVRQEQWQRTAQKVVRRGLHDHGLWPARAPELEAAEGGAEVVASFEVFPDPPAIDLAALVVERPKVELTEADVDFMSDTVFSRHVHWVDYDPDEDPASRAERELDLMRELGDESGDLANFRMELRRAVTKELEEALDEEIVVNVERALVAAHGDLELPAHLLELQSERLRAAAERLDWRAGYNREAEARRLLAETFLFAAVARQEGIRLDPTETFAETERLAELARHPQEELDRYWSDGTMIQVVEDRLLRKKVAAVVMAKARVEDVEMSLEQLREIRVERPDLDEWGIPL